MHPSCMVLFIPAEPITYLLWGVENSAAAGVQALGLCAHVLLLGLLASGLAANHQPRLLRHA